MPQSIERPFAPCATYRLQLNHSLTFSGARQLAGYLRALGVDTCYASPILKARPGSMHGYDVIDHQTINPEIGSVKDLEQFAAGLRKLGMGLIVDIVPNHMCVSGNGNGKWADVLENGSSSPDAPFFDIDWNPPRDNMADKVLLPILGDQYGRVLENQEIRIEYVAGAFVAKYYEIALPLAPRSWTHILDPAVEALNRDLGTDAPEVLELESIGTALRYLPARTETDGARIRERQREKEIVKQRLSTLSSRCEAVRSAIAEALVAINGRKGDAASFDALEQLLAGQAYRASYWRVASDEINYRRFFDVNELAAIRTEDPAVFEQTHAVIFNLVRKGWINGLRIDHPDGLFDPRQYFDELQRGCSHSRRTSAFYVVAEKIVAPHESLREDWAIHGTTGYDFLNLLNGLFVYPESRRIFQSLYEKWLGSRVRISDLIYQSKQLILDTSMSSELNVLSRRLDRICQQHRHTRDFTLENLRFALREILACFAVYRTYITAGHTRPNAEDSRHILAAIADAKRRNAVTSASVFDAIGAILLLENPEGLTEQQSAERRLFVMRFQQLSSPVMAKGVEDTAFYRYYPLASLNEVGGELEEFGVTPQAFHRQNQFRQRRWPFTMNATSTHDTKRGEDTRARLNVLSEIPVEWFHAVRQWSTWNQSKKTNIGGIIVPDQNAEYLLYQTLVGTWPPGSFRSEERDEYVRRIQQYMEKALKEAKVHTSWINPLHSYDQAIAGFVAAVLRPSESRRFLESLEKFVARVARAGMFNSLSQTLLKIASPGVPDIYQGCETWHFSLVDPDNRRPVDFAKLREDLAVLQDVRESRPGELVSRLLRTPHDGRIKLHVTSRALNYRREHRELFEKGRYIPLQISGSRRSHVIAFARTHGEGTVVAAAGRFFLKLGSRLAAPAGNSVWEDTALVLPKALQFAGYRDVLTGKTIRPKEGALRLGTVFSSMPAALLTVASSAAAEHSR